MARRSGGADRAESTKPSTRARHTSHARAAASSRPSAIPVPAFGYAKDLELAAGTVEARVGAVPGAEPADHDDHEENEECFHGCSIGRDDYQRKSWYFSKRSWNLITGSVSSSAISQRWRPSQAKALSAGQPNGSATRNQRSASRSRRWRGSSARSSSSAPGALAPSRRPRPAPR